MSLDDAINEVKALILGASPGAAIKVVRISDEEARLSVDVAAAEIEAVKLAVRDRLTQLLVSEGLDVQVQVYDKDAPKGVVADE
ncbi:MAG: hypothetical protein RMK99_14750 [Anaerolineales bacterium]|nr:hypothetical protein [Anaerolineales bacterium]